MADLSISEEEIARLMSAFNAHDTDGDGLISTAQLGKVLHTLGQNPTDAELQVRKYMHEDVFLAKGQTAH